MANGMLGVSGLFISVKAMWIFLGLAWLAIGILGGRWASVWLRFRGTRVITCPENTRPAGVHVDERHAAASPRRGTPTLRLSACSRWPERQGCGQACLAQIEAWPEGCLARNISLPNGTGARYAPAVDCRLAKSGGRRRKSPR